jgi:hypothetical protein
LLKWNNDSIQKLQEKIEQLNGQHPLSEILTDNFITENTKFTSLQDFLEATRFKFDTQDDIDSIIDSIPESNWDNFVIQHTSFSSWQEFLAKAGEEYAVRILNLT